MTEAFMQTFPRAPTRDLVEIKIGKTWGDMRTYPLAEKDD